MESHWNSLELMPKTHLTHDGVFGVPKRININNNFGAKNL